MGKQNDFESFCKKQNKLYLLDEWDYNKNYNMPEPSIIKYNSSLNIWWKCPNGHSYYRTVAARTIFDMGCKECKHENLAIGTQYGCLSIVDDFSAYKREVADIKIAKLEQSKLDFIAGKKSENNNFDSVETFDRWIEKFKNTEVYKCQCKCGKTYFFKEDEFLRKKRKYCSEDCEIKKLHITSIQNTYERVKDDSYDINFSNTIHESLQVLECIDENFEKLHSYIPRLTRGGGTYKLYKKYKCRCYLCGKTYEFLSSDFEIKNDIYGKNATKGYYSEACCSCHKISSFQWRTVDILKKYNIKYKVEVSFQDLYGIGNKKLLRYDFAIYDDKNNVKYLIECQGEQHYRPVEEFGGDSQYNIQKENDKLKRDYANKNNIEIIEIPYTCDTYEKEEEFLKSNCILP